MWEYVWTVPLFLPLQACIWEGQVLIPYCTKGHRIWVTDKADFDKVYHFISVDILHISTQPPILSNKSDITGSSTQEGKSKVQLVCHLLTQTPCRGPTNFRWCDLVQSPRPRSGGENLVRKGGDRLKPKFPSRPVRGSWYLIRQFVVEKVAPAGSKILRIVPIRWTLDTLEENILRPLKYGGPPMHCWRNIDKVLTFHTNVSVALLLPGACFTSAYCLQTTPTKI